MRDREPTIRSRELGEGLRRAMRKAGLNGTQAAQQLGWSTSRVSRLLSGKRGGSEVDAASFLAVCRVTGRERDRLLALCHEQNTPGWLQQHGSSLPKQLRTLIDHENKATAISDFELAGIPGLLQTGDYARAVLSRVVNVPADEVEDRVAARLARQSLFSRERPARFAFFVHEFALRLPVGGPAVMSDQLHHLLRMSVRPSLTLRVLPAALGAHPAMTGAFRLMEFAQYKPVVYVESETSCLFLEQPQEIAAYRNILAALADSALNAEQSRELIATLATELYADRGDNDGHA
ncbi:helix-turn-helix domain-containing protein [Gandjariella thermophila]|uniref:Transcriptional regulator n=1 Tax=Gandjariella thermophila TaxID=1931992 RepID=A0A4D4J398_9PSEU|nr:helix-turn-helix transcriptional regulator [Gandjariella thermophila]GDY29552.1 transcriptional regulator [Gandjariella thermophila]